MRPEGSKIPKKVFKMSRGVSYYFERGSLFQAFTSTSSHNRSRIIFPNFPNCGKVTSQNLES